MSVWFLYGIAVYSTTIGIFCGKYLERIDWKYSAETGVRRRIRNKFYKVEEVDP